MKKLVICVCIATFATMVAGCNSLQIAPPDRKAATVQSKAADAGKTESANTDAWLAGKKK